MSIKLSNPVSNYVSGVYQPPLSVKLECPSVSVAPTSVDTRLSSNNPYNSRNVCKINGTLFFNAQPFGSSNGGLGLYNIPTNTISEVACPYDTYNANFVNVNGVVYIIGGFDPPRVENHNKIMKYDGVVSTVGGELPILLRNISCCSIGTNIYIIGGYTGAVNVKTIYKYDTVNDNVVEFPVSLNVACSNSACCVYQNRYIYVVDGASASNKIQIIDTVDKTVVNMSKDLPRSRVGAGAMIKEDFLYVFGGNDPTHRETVYKKYIHDDSDWVLDTQTLAYARSHFGYTSDEKGYYHIIGGYYSIYYETGRFGLPSSDVEIRYTQTEDGSIPPDPTYADTLYTSPIELTSPTKHKIKAKAFYTGV